MVSGPPTGNGASLLVLGHRGVSQTPSKLVRFYTFNMCPLLHFNQMVKKTYVVKRESE